MIDEIDALDGSMLHVATRLREIAAIEPSPVAVARVRMALLAAAPAARPAVGGLRLNLWPRPAAALAFAMMLLAIGTTSVFASPSALPDSPLYAIRNVKETLQVQLAGTKAQRARLYASFAAERSAQLRAVTRTKQVTDASVLQTLLRDITDRVHEANLAATGDGQDARSAVQQAEAQIGSQLNQIQQEGNFPANQEDSLTNTLRAVQSGQTGQSGPSGDSGGSDNSNQP
jgi:hypothetical protein